MRGSSWRHFLDRALGIPLTALLSVPGRLLHQVGAGSPRPRLEHPLPLDPAPRRILWLKLAALGDTVLLIPALRAVRQAYPAARIAFVATRINAEILRGCPYVDEVLLLDVAAVFSRPLRFWRFVEQLRAFGPDLAIDAEQWTRLTPLLAFLAGAPARVGFRTAGQARHFLFTRTVPHSKQRHEVESFLDLVRALGIEPADRRLELFLDPAAREEAAAILRDQALETAAGPLVIFHPGCGAHGGRREWAPGRYAQLGDRLAERYGARVVITGDPSERRLAEAIGAQMRHRPALAAGRTSISGLAALLARADLVVCGNTGAMHLAAAAGVPTVALHGPTNPQQWGPWGNRAEVVRLGLSCSPCLYLGHEYGCKPAPCMGEMTVEMVWDAARRLLSSGPGQPAWREVSAVQEQARFSV